jgi:hypothetical protein
LTPLPRFNSAVNVEAGEIQNGPELWALATDFTALILINWYLSELKH